jgi:hypothetical protein
MLYCIIIRRVDVSPSWRKEREQSEKKEKKVFC